jgi:hypothetical protein
VRGIRVRSVLVAVEVAASVALLVWAGLLLRALDRIDGMDPGFRPESVLTARTALPRPKYTLALRRQAYFTQVLDQVRALPGVSHAGFVSFLPMTMPGGISRSRYLVSRHKSAGAWRACVSPRLTTSRRWAFP